MTDGYQRTDLNIEVQSCCFIGGVWVLQIRVIGGFTNVATTLARAPPSTFLYVPAALVYRAQPHCITQLPAVVQRSYLTASSLAALLHTYQHSVDPCIDTTSHADNDQHCADPRLIASHTHSHAVMNVASNVPQTLLVQLSST